ncbi:MAG: DUF1804 family protein [Flavobacteriales bacterium]
MKDRNSKKDLGRLLYVENGLTQKQIATRLGVSTVTVGRWSAKDDWTRLRATHIMGKKETLSRLYEQITELDNAIRSKPKGQRYADSKQADTLVKLTASVERLETKKSLSRITDVLKDFLRWTAENLDKDESMKIIDLTDKYVNEKALNIE